MSQGGIRRDSSSFFVESDFFFSLSAFGFARVVRICAWYGVLSGMAFIVYLDWMQLWIGGIINFFLLNLLSTRLYQN